MIHSYEKLLAANNPALRKRRGVWYTPHATVSFIVRAVDEVLQKDFNLMLGLADTNVHVLDPATGTGLFLLETVKHIYDKFNKRSDHWHEYVQKCLIPRLTGFEILKEPFETAYSNLAWLFRQTGFELTDNQSFRIYRTNALQEPCPSIDCNTPIMVVMGNPPYRAITANQGLGDIEEYKYVDGVHFNERKHWLHDDYVKFIRLGQTFVDKNREGILAYITNHSFIDNPTFRGMRWNLMRSFDKIYILDLHGDSKTKKGVCPDGSKDENVFDIQQGVSINIFIKTGRKAEKAFAKIYHYDLYGRRRAKYDFLCKTKFSKVRFVPVKPTAPYYFLSPRNEDNLTEYEQGFKIDELMSVNTTGIVSMGDSFAFAESKEELRNRLQIFLERDYTQDQLNDEFSLGKNYAEFILQAKKTLEINADTFVKVDYRPFDKIWTYFDNRILWRPRTKVMQHFLWSDNAGLIFKRGFTENAPPVFVTHNIVDFRCWSRPGMQGGDYVAPLYLYHTDELLENKHRSPNLDAKIVEKIAQTVKLEFEVEKSGNAKKFAPIDILDYIYAVLHSPAYREKYKEFLKIDFPRVPYPDNAKQFRNLVKLGEKLRRLHLMEDVEPRKNLANYDVLHDDVKRDNVVEKLEYKNGKVFINDKQFFGNVPSEVWNFYIGGYQPAQKWLKDRKGRILNFEKIQHYQKIIRVLHETEKIMCEVDTIMISEPPKSR